MRKLLVCVSSFVGEEYQKERRKGEKRTKFKFSWISIESASSHSERCLHITIPVDGPNLDCFSFFFVLFCFCFSSHCSFIFYVCRCRSLCMFQLGHLAGRLATEPKWKHSSSQKKKKEKKFYELIPILYLVLMLCSVFFFSGFVFHFLFCLFHLSSCFHSFIRTHHHWVDVILHPILLYTSGIYGIRA